MDAIQQRKIDLAVRAAYEGDLRTLRQYVEQEGISVDAINSKGESLLHRAAYSGNTDVVNYLLGRNAKANARNVNGFTPLMFALASGNFNTSLADSLIKAGADINARTDAGAELLDIVGGNPGVSKEALLWLKVKGINISGNTAQINPSVIFGALEAKNTQLVEAYVQAGGSLAVKDNDGRTVLHYAAATLRPDIFSFISQSAVAQGLNLTNIADKAGVTPLQQLTASLKWPKPEEMTAENKEHIARQEKIAAMLLNAGADVGHVTKEGGTALMLAAQNGNEVLTPLFLSHNAPTGQHTLNGYTAYVAASGAGKDVVAAQIAERMKSDPYYRSGFDGLPSLNGKNLVESLVLNGTRVPVYTLDANSYEFKNDSGLAVAPLAKYQQKRSGNLLIVESNSDHHIGTYFSALDTYQRLTGASRNDAEKMIIPVNELMEPRGNFAQGISPTSQMTPGFRSLLESQKNEVVRRNSFVSISYYTGDEKSFHYDASRAASLGDAAKTYANIDIGGIGFAVANDANDVKKANVAKSQPWRANPGTLFIGAASKDKDGHYIMDNYADNGPQISAPLPPYYDKVNEVPERGTSFAAPAFNAYRLALHNGTAHLSPREIDAALMTTANTNIRSDSVAEGAGKPYKFASNGTVWYNEKVGVGVADIGKAYERARTLDDKKAEWLKSHGEDVPVRLNLVAGNPKQVSVGGAAKYEYAIKIPKDIYIQQFASSTLGTIGANGQPSANQSRIIAPNGFVQQARADVYGNASLPGMYGIKMAAGDVIKIISDQPLEKPSIDINGFSPNSFFAQIMRQAQADRAAEKLRLNDVIPAVSNNVPSISCAAISAKLYNAEVANCR